MSAPTSPRRDVYKVVAARFLSRAGSEAAFFVGVWGTAAFVMDADATELAVLMFALSVSSILGTLFAGVLVDRYGPRRVLMAAEVLFVPAALAVPLANDMLQLTVLVSVWAFAGAPVVTAGASFAPYLTNPDQPLEKINSWIEGAGAVSFVVGPALGALVVAYSDVGLVFVIDAATSLIAALLVARVSITVPQREEREARRPFAEIRKGLATVYTSRSLRYYVLTGTLVWLAFGAFGALEPLFFRDVVGTGMEAIGWVNAIFGLGFVTGAALLPRLPGGIISARGLGALVALTGLGTALYVGWPDLRVIAIGGFAWAVVIGVLEPLLRTLLHRDSPPGTIGRVQGTAEIHRRVGELLPLAFAPALAVTIGVQATLIGGGLVATAVALLSLPIAVSIDREKRAEPVPEVEVQGVRAADEPISPNP
jgi:MFS family permease